MKVRNIIHRALLSATALFIASTASFAEESNLVVNWDGNGSTDSPYLIKNANDLAAIAYYTEKGVSFANVYFKMTANIDLSAYDNWTPIGSKTYKFEGSFDGGGKTISSLKIDAGTTDCIGLFGAISDAVIKNLTIGEGSTIIGRNWTGAFAGLAYGNSILSNLCNKSSVTGAQTVGGILGHTDDKANTSILNCSNYGAITSKYPDEHKYSFVGGLAGFVNNGVIDCCANYGTVSGNGIYVAGIVGAGAGNEGAKSLIISNCTNSSTGTVIGGINNIAGIVSYLGLSTTGTIVKVVGCTNEAAVSLAESATSGENIGGIIGHSRGPGIVIDNCTNTGSVTGNFGRVGGIVATGTAPQISNCVNSGTITNGGNAATTNGTCGGIVGLMSGIDITTSFVRNCINSGTVKSDGYLVGGVVAYFASDGKSQNRIENCTNTGNVTALGHSFVDASKNDCNIGGILGHGPCLVVGCKNTGKITSYYGNVGGIVGALGGVVNCCNEGDIHGESANAVNVGGLVGYSSTYSADFAYQGVYNSYSRGNVYVANENCGGLLMGVCQTNLQLCYADGTVYVNNVAASHYIFKADFNPNSKYDEYSDPDKKIPTYGRRNCAFSFGESVADVVKGAGGMPSGNGLGYFSLKDNSYITFKGNKLEEFLDDALTDDVYKNFKLCGENIPLESWCGNTSGVTKYPIFGDPTTGTPKEPGYIEPEVVTYSVSYDLNATGTPTGISAPSPQSGSESYEVQDIVSEGVYSYVSGNVKYSFTGWNTKPDGTGDSYVAGSMITPSANTVLYGMWTAGFQVRYALASGLSADDFVSLTLPFDPTWYNANDLVTVQMPGAGDFSPKVFDFWSTEPDGSGDRYGTAYISENQNKFNITKDMVLYANVHDEWLQKIVIERTGLKAGESAVYKVVGTEGGSSFVVALEGREESGAPVKVSTTITKVPTGDYTVTETGWNWAYNKEDEVDVQPESQKKSATQGTATATMDDNRTLTFTFGGDIKGETPKHGENVKGTK